MPKLVAGIGINDADYAVAPRVGGEPQWCPFYRTWSSMLRRCKVHGCTVVIAWQRFSAFKCWMMQQDWEGKELDKDILVPGNKVYGPDTCLMVPKEVNMFVIEKTSCRGRWPIGVDFHGSSGKFRASIGLPRRHLGLYNTPEEAHAVYMKAKRAAARELAAKQTDPRVALALLSRYKENTDAK